MVWPAHSMQAGYMESQIETRMPTHQFIMKNGMLKGLDAFVLDPAKLLPGGLPYGEPN